jgi:hypothetical protein
MRPEKLDVPLVSDTARIGPFELIDAVELAARWRVPESWVRSRTRSRTPKEERIPCIRLGRYVRFEWGSPRLTEWLARQQQ